MTQVFEAWGLDDVGSLMHDVYGARRVTSGRERPHLRVAQDQLPGVRLDHLDFGMEAELRLPQNDLIYVGQIISGAIDYDYDEGFKAGDVVYGGGMSRPFVARVSDFVVDWVAIEPALLSELGGLDLASSDQVRLLDHRPLSSAAGQEWSRTYSFIRDMVDGDPDLVHKPLVAQQAARLLAAVTLATYPNTGRLDPTAQDRRDAHPKTVARAVTYIEANPADDLTAAKIASAAGVTSRAVQIAFRRHLDATPMGYVRRVRLAQARDELRRATWGATTVTEVAGKWGFSNLSRFSRAYRSAFGETPSETLRH